MKDFVILVSGEAGFGVESLSKTLSLFFMREGFGVLANSEYENRIRGGNVHTFVRIGETEVTGYRSTEIEVLIAMDGASVLLHQDKIKKNGIIIYDPRKLKKLDGTREDLNFVPVQMQEIASKVIGMGLARNVVAAGALFGVTDYPSEGFKNSLAEIFKKKGEEVIQKNHQALDEGVKEVEKSGVKISFDLEARNPKSFLVHGNEAISFGAIKAGCKYLSAYPMTPGSTVMTTMAKEARDYDVVVSHVEDEIAAVVNAIGAGYTGVRAMTSTSGGGFALMSEAVSLSGMIEAPVLIVDAQRPGPSTGLPTRTAQADLRMALHAGQGDLPRLVVAPGDQEECLHLTFDTFNFIEKYQFPAILLTEKYLADTYKSIPLDIFEKGNWEIQRGEVVSEIENPEDFRRFKITEDGISPRALPGTVNGAHTTSSYEHNELGKAEEEIEKVVAMQDKRMRKLETLKKELPLPVLHGEKEAQVTLVGWGATKGALLESLELLKKEGISANFLQFQYLFPFKEEIEELLKGKNLISVETNFSGQLASVITENTGIKIKNQIKSYTGRQITAEWVASELKKIIQ